MAKDSSKQGVIWIKGFSASGKTTVARKVEFLLKQSGHNIIALDGDELRSIFEKHKSSKLPGCRPTLYD